MNQGTESMMSKRRQRKSGVVVPHRPRWYQRLGAWGVFALIRLVSLTFRYRWNEPSSMFGGTPPGPAIYCTWHNRLGLSMKTYFGYVRRWSRTPGLVAMVSASKDGGFLAGILECFGVQPVRGSSSRRGPQALLELTTWADRGYDLAITPDGPRGPRYQVQDGVIALAQITGLPIVPFSYHARWKYQAKSWDRFQIPLPFTRCEMNFGKAIWVPRQCSEEQREALRQQLEKALVELSED
jgi:hypothetical protein